MNVEQIAVVHGLIVVVAVLLWFYGPWQALVIEWARQGISELRDDWFDAAVPGGPHRNPVEARTVLDVCDAVTKRMEALSLPGVLAMSWWLRTDPQANCRRTLSAQLCAIADQSLRRVALQTVDRTGDYVAAQTFARSLISFPYGLLLITRVEWPRRSAFRLKSSAPVNRRSNRQQLSNVPGRLIRRELEIAAAVSNDPFAAIYLRRGLPAHGWW